MAQHADSACAWDAMTHGPYNSRPAEGRVEQATAPSPGRPRAGGGGATGGAALRPAPLLRNALADGRPVPRRARADGGRRSRTSRTTSTSARSAAASGRATTPAARGSRSSTAADRLDRRASRSRRRTRTSSTSAPARPTCARTSPTATACTSPPTAAGPGRASASPDTRQIGRILVDPQRPEPRLRRRARARATARTRSAASSARRTAAQTWTRVLFKDDEHGRDRPRVRSRRTRRRSSPRSGRRGGRPGTSTRRRTARAAGSTARRTAATRGRRSRDGFPSEKLGRIGLAFAPTRPERVYAIVDAKEGGLYVSEDGGATWTRASARPADLGARLVLRRRDGRSEERRRRLRLRHRDVPLDRRRQDVPPVQGRAGRRRLPPRSGSIPADSRRMIVASDQGAVVTRGRREDVELLVQPADRAVLPRRDRRPVPVLDLRRAAGQRRRGDARRARTTAAITLRDWRPIAAGGENGYIAPDPDGPEHPLRRRRRPLRLDDAPGAGRRSDARVSRASTGASGRCRSSISPRDPKALYFGNQFVFRTTDDGRHWEKISPDLTRENPAVPATLDPVTAKDSRRSRARGAASSTRSRRRRSPTGCSGAARTTA